MKTSVSRTVMFSGPASVSRGSIYIETYGCAFNVSDSEVMAGLLERAGYSITSDAALADAVIVNSCTVKDRTYLEFQKRIRSLSASDGKSAERQDVTPAVIIAGCVPRVHSQSREFSRFSQVGPDNLAAVVDVVERTLAGETVIQLAREKSDRLTLPHRRRNRMIEIIPISRGCLGSCTFCQTVLARGRLQSFPETHILDRVRQAAAEGVAEVWLTSQDCGAYGFDCGTNLARLMRKISVIDGNFMVRVGMANPDLIKLFLNEFVEALSHPRFFQFAHIPVQAGSDRVLADMERLYSVDDFRGICRSLRERMPEVTIATDIIAGFPTESGEDFEETLRLLEETRIPVVNRSRFSPRPGTRAARLKVLPSSEVSARSRTLFNKAREIATRDLQSWSQWRGQIIVEEHPRPGISLARNAAYKPIILHGEYDPGQRLDIVCNGFDGFHLNGYVKQDVEQPMAVPV